MKRKVNCCDGMYNSLDVHFTSACDNKCAHCIDSRFAGLGIKKPNAAAIAESIIKNSEGIDDVLFLGGEPLLFIDELLQCVKTIKRETKLKIFATTSMPKVCHDKKDTFIELLELLDGLNISVQHHEEKVADQIRRTVSRFDRQKFYRELPMKEKIRINLNIVKPIFFLRSEISDCLKHYDSMGFNSIKISEIQHGKDVFVSFADIFGIKMKSAYANGCQTYLDMDKILPGIKTPVLLKRSCFVCEESLGASLADGAKILLNMFSKPTNRYGVIYGDGTLTRGWV